MAQLLCRDLTLGYDQKSILEHSNFEVNAGDYLRIAGENGSGKSTLMKVILGLQPSFAGMVERGDGLRTNRIGYLPQQTLVRRDLPASVEEIVLSGWQGRTGFRSLYRKADWESAGKNMECMGITALRKRCCRELSGGQQQRVPLAQALCATEKVLSLNEPASGLDPKVTADTYQLIQGLNEEGTTVIMISHDIAVAVQYASRILHIGKKVFFGTREEYQHSRFGEQFSQEESVNA